MSVEMSAGKQTSSKMPAINNMRSSGNIAASIVTY
jgi:hypothetical protein